MRVNLKIPVANVVHTGKLPLRPKTLKFALALLRGALFPPVPVERLSSGNFKLKGGRHRLAAHKLVGKKEISANFALPEAPNPFKPLAVSPRDVVLPQADGSPLELTETPKE